MSQWLTYALSGAALFAVGLLGIFTAGPVGRAGAAGPLVRRVLAANIMGSGVFLVLVALARRGGGAPDPVPHALVLTGIVVSVSATAMALAVSRRGERSPERSGERSGEQPPGRPTRQPDDEADG